MKQFYVLILLSFFSYGITNAQIVNIPDENFKSALLDYTDPVIDTNDDGEIQVSEAEFVMNLNVYSSNISDLTGIEAFSNLNSLIANSNNLISMDFSLPELRSLSVSYNGISDINLLNFPLIESLNLRNTNITSIDLSAVPFLEVLNLRNTNITSIDLSTVPLLEVLNLNYNELQTLDVSNNTLLEDLQIADNSISNLDITMCTELELLSAFDNNLLEIDLSQNTNLRIALITGNNFENLNFTTNTMISQLFVGNSELTSLNLSANINLEQLNIVNAESLTNLNLTNNQILKYLFVENSFLESLETSNNGNLVWVFLINTHFSSLDFSNNADLLRLSIQGNPTLNSLNLKNGNNLNIDNDSHILYFENIPNQTSSFISSVIIQSCPNLNLVCVDNTDYAASTFTEVDTTVTFIEDCSIAGSSNIFMGNINYDEDINGCDNNDPVGNNFLINSNDGINDFAISVSENGSYILHVVENTYTTEVLNVPVYFTVSPQASTHTFEGYDNEEQLDFCLTANQTIADLNITLLPISEARPGFEADYQLVVENMGTQTVAAANISLTFDEHAQNFVMATPAETSSTTNELTFEVNDLPPFGQQVIDFTLQTFQPPTVNGDDVLNFTAEVTPDTNDYTPQDNTFAYEQIVVNSYDPNDKQVLQGSQVHIDDADQYLDYLIRFQNTGTASAINVRVVDTLHPNLDYSTLKPINASDNYRVEITNGNHVEFIFEDIYLPHEAADEEGSNGFIAYKIKPKDNMTVGDVISGDAQIYFDFNAPIITNMVATEFVDDLGIPGENSAKSQIVIYPNPANNLLNLQPNRGVVLEEVVIYNLQGRKLLNFNKNLEQINLENLSAGMYILNIKTNEGSINKQLVKK